MIRFLETWHTFALRRFRRVHAALAVVSAVLVWDALRTTVSPNWLDLFSGDDPVYVAYRDSGAATSTRNDVYIRFRRALPEEAGGLLSQLETQPGVANVVVLPETPAQTAGERWVKVVLQGDASLRPKDRPEALESIDRAARAYDPAARMTGAEVILQEFTESVTGDFVRSSMLSMLLVGTVVLLAFRPTSVTVLGCAYELIGLLLSLAVCRRLCGSLNMLSAALPCVLIGLGVDFVIHAVASAEDAGDCPEGCRGLLVYRRVARPMFLGAATTSLAFLSLCTARLPGLHSFGILGAVSMLIMFVVVMLMLPPSLSRLAGSPRTVPGPSARPSRLVPRRRNTKRWVAAGTVAGCVVAGIGVTCVRMEDRIENLYDPTLPSLRLQDELTAGLGVYPSSLFLSFSAKDPQRVVAGMAPRCTTVLCGGLSSVASREAGSERRVAVCLLPYGNPFERHRLARIRVETESLAVRYGAVSPVLSGDAVLCAHMNDLLVTGLSRAFGCIVFVLAVVLLCAYRRLRYVAAPLLCLGMSIAATLGFLGGVGVRLSAYTLVLFPLFVGIGVDDFLYVCHVYAEGGSLAGARHVVKGIALTTLTTVLGYGALCVANNPGFRAMGVTAAVGLTLTFLNAVYVMPVLLERRRRRVRSTSG